MKFLRRNDRLSWLIVALSLVVQSVYAMGLQGHLLGSFPVLTAEAYDAWARHWIHGQGLSPDVFRHAAGYFLIVALVYFVTNASFWFLYMLQAVLVALACGVLSAWCGARYSRRWGWWVGIVTALNGPLIFFAFQISPASWAFCGMVGLILGFDWLCRRNLPWAWFVAGGCFVVAGWVHPVLMAGGAGGLAAFLLFGSPQVSSKERVRLFGRAVAGSMSVGLLLGLFVYSNVKVFTVFPAQDSQILYLTHHGESCEQRNPRPGPGWDRIVRWARAHDAISLKDQRAFFSERAFYSLGHEPLRWVFRWFEKVAQITSGREPGGDLSPYVSHEVSPLLRGLVWRMGGFGFPWGFLVPLALVGWVVNRRRFPPWFYGVTLGCILAGIIFRVTSEYRLGLLPLLAVMSAGGATHLWDSVRLVNVRRAVIVWAASMALAVLISLPGPFCSERVDYHAAWRVAVAQRALTRGDVILARRMYEEAVILAPGNPVVANGLANVHLAEGNLETAAEHVRRALALAGDYALAWFNLALIEELQGRDEAAIEAFTVGLSFQSWRGQAHHDLARLLIRQGDREQALFHLSYAIELDPYVPENVIVLLDLLLRENNFAEAMPFVERARGMVPVDSKLAARAGIAAWRNGGFNEAAGYFAVALALDPDDPVAAYGMAGLLLQEGLYDRARMFYSQAFAIDPIGRNVWLTRDEVNWFETD